MKKNYYNQSSNQFIYSIFYSHSPVRHNRYRNHNHTETELGFILKGAGKYNLSDKNYDICEGDLFIVRSNEQHCVPTVLGETLTSFNIYLSSYYLWNICSDYIGPDKIKALVSSEVEIQNKLCDSDIVSLYSKIIKLYDNQTDENVYKLRSLILELIITISQKIDTNSTEEIPPVKCLNEIQNAVLFIKQNYTKQISLDDIAKSATMSRSYLSSTFKSFTGMSPYNYLMTTRIERAVELLKRTDKKILNIALECGFTSLTSFNKSFKRLVGVTPFELRQLHK